MATTTFERERSLVAAIAPTVERALPSVRVLAVELVSPNRFCVYIDHESGVDFDLCSRVTGLLDAYRETWSIDVSSPGPERPLRRIEHFAAAVGKTVQVRTDRKIDGRTRFRGPIGAAGDGVVTVEHEGTTHEIPVDTIVRANLIDEGWEP